MGPKKQNSFSNLRNENQLKNQIKKSLSLIWRNESHTNLPVYASKVQIFPEIIKSNTI